MIRVKICGITNLEDALVAAEAGADLLGFIFYEPSPRYVAPEVVREIVFRIREQAPVEDKRPDFIGVFVNASPETVVHTLELCHLDAAQLHGDEPPEFVAALPGRAYKALRPQSLSEANLMLRHYSSSTSPPNPPTSPPANLPTLPTFLLDAYHPTLYGGTGRVTDWTIAAHVARQHPIMLAGSLTPDNVVRAIAAVQPWGIDAGSGVERKKGKKDHAKVRQLIEAVNF